MREVAGEYNTAKIFTDVVDDASIAQVKELCDQEFCTGSRIRLMPDIHAGAGCTVGTTMTIKDKVVPNLVGVDIGCGMETAKIKKSNRKSKDTSLNINAIFLRRLPMLTGLYLMTTFTT